MIARPFMDMMASTFSVSCTPLWHDAVYTSVDVMKSLSSADFKAMKMFGSRLKATKDEKQAFVTRYDTIADKSRGQSPRGFARSAFAVRHPVHSTWARCNSRNAVVGAERLLAPDPKHEKAIRGISYVPNETVRSLKDVLDSDERFVIYAVSRGLCADRGLMYARRT